MKEKLHFAIEAVLIVAVVILFVFQFSGNKKSPSVSVAASSGSEYTPGASMPVAYIDLDSLILNYKYSIDMNDHLMDKSEKSRAELTEKQRKFQNDVQSFQSKAETGAFTSQERMDAEREKLIKAEQDLQTLSTKLSQEFAEEQARLNEGFRATIIAQLKEFNKDKTYHIVYGKTSDNILYADDAYNITTEILEYFNKKYAESPAFPSK
jgi:Outer membrane protein